MAIRGEKLYPIKSSKEYDMDFFYISKKNKNVLKWKA